MVDVNVPFAPLASDGPARWSAGRVRSAVGIVAPALVLLAVLGAYADGNVQSFAYVASLGMSALLVLLASAALGHDGVGWRWVGVGMALWAVTGCLVTLANESSIVTPPLVTSLGYAVGYVPIMIGLAVLGDQRWKVRRATTFIDAIIVFLVLYGIVWLLVVERISFDSSLSRMDRAFESMYPAGDLAVIVLAVRVAAARALRRRAAGLLLLGSALSAAADIWLLIGYLRDPEGSYPITDLLYLLGLAVIAIAAMWSLLPSPPHLEEQDRRVRWVPVAVAVSAVLPPIVLLVVSVLSDRAISVPAIAVWLLAMVVAMIARSLAGVREVERAHEHASWLASHDLPTGMLQRAAFLHEVAEGTLRERSGTVIVLEVQGLRAVAESHGFDAAESVVDTVAFRLRSAVGAGAVLARMDKDQFVAFLRSVDLGAGRQVAEGVQHAMRQPVVLRDEPVDLEAALGVAQADGAVIDVLAGVRRATAAMHQARGLRHGGLAFDADLTGTPDA